MKRFVLSGPACSGKSATIKFISEIGFQVTREAAREVILHQKNETGSCPSIGGNAKDKIAFQIEVYKQQLKIENEIRESDYCFYDRGIYDGLAFLKMDNIAPPEWLVNNIKNFKYDKVFLFEILPVFSRDRARKERDKDTANKAYPFLKEIYESFGCPVVEVPNFSNNEKENIRLRWEFIKAHLD